MDVGEGGRSTADGAGGLGGYECTNVESVSVDNFGEDGDSGMDVWHAKEMAASV
jgi:hypothetical protein